MSNWLFSFFGPNYQALELQGQDPNEAVRAAALQKLRTLATPKAVESLYRIAAGQPNIYGLDKEVAEVIRQFDEPKVLPALARLVDRFVEQPSYLTEKLAQEAIWKISGWSAGLSVVFQVLSRVVADFRAQPESVKQQVTRYAIGTLATFPGKEVEAFETLSAVVADYIKEPVFVREAVTKAALYNFARLATPEALDYLLQIRMPNERMQGVVRVAIADRVRKVLDLPEINSFSQLANWSAALEQLDPQVAAAVLPPMMDVIADPRNSDEWDLRCVLPLLASLGQNFAVPLLVGALHINRQQSEKLQIWAAHALGELGDRRAVDALIDACDYEHHSVRFAAINALVKIAEIPVRRTLFTPDAWDAYSLEAWLDDAQEQSRQALAVLLPSYRKVDYSAGSAFLGAAGKLTPNQQVFQAAACAALDRMRTLTLEDTPLHRQIQSTLQHLRQTRDIGDPRRWVCTIEDFAPLDNDFLSDLAARIRWDGSSGDEVRKQQVILATAQDQLLTALRKLGFLEKVGDKNQMAGFLVQPYVRDFQIRF